MARVTIKGNRELSEKLKRLRTVASAPVRIGVGKAAELIVEEQKRLVPVVTGRLRDSIQWSFNAPPSGVRLGGARTGQQANETRAFITAGDRKAFYAPFVEFGTTSMQAQPFFYPGYRIMRKRAKAEIAKAIKAAVKGIAQG